MFKRILLIIGMVWWLAAGMSLMAEEGEMINPRIVLNPTTFHVGELTPPGPYFQSIAINNIGKSLLYISKIKFT